jgi:Phospholipase_D-nuclease N-terminal
VEFGAIFVLAMLVFWVWALIDCAMTDGSAVRAIPKVAWIILIVLFGALAGFAWVLFGRPKRTGVGGARPTRIDYAKRRPPPPDDRQITSTRPEISDRRSAELDERLARWEREQRERGPDQT